jgi:hypothetical protein
MSYKIIGTYPKEHRLRMRQPCWNLPCERGVKNPKVVSSPLVFTHFALYLLDTSLISLKTILSTCSENVTRHISTTTVLCPRACAKQVHDKREDILSEYILRLETVISYRKNIRILSISLDRTNCRRVL